MSDYNAAWEKEQRERDALYKAELDKFDPDRIGLRVVCPNCRAESWLKLSENRYGHPPFGITCPTACGAYGALDAFSARAQTKEAAGHFDLHYICRVDETETLSNGSIFRCPVRAIENPRRIMRDLKESILTKLEENSDADALADYIGKIVSTFDGVMRASNKLAAANREVLRSSAPQAQMAEVTRVASFQNVTAARAKLLPEWDMAACVSDWSRFIMIFQKRHLFAHTLGVADEDYLKKSGDTETPIGKKVTLTPDDVIFFANEAEEIVRDYFGHFLS